MSETYAYDIATETLNGRVNLEVLSRGLLNAGLASGGTFEGIDVVGGTNDDTREGVIVGGAMAITWASTLSGGDETTQDAMVAAHPGDGFHGTQPITAESLGVSSTGSSIVKLSLTPGGPLAEGMYELAASAEIQVQSGVAGSHAQGTVTQDASELIQHNNPEDMFEVFGITTIIQLEAGTTPTFEITLALVGNPNTVEIQQARLSLRLVG